MLCKRERSNQLNGYIDILPSKELIDGIWQNTPDNIKIDVFPIQKIIFFNPSIEPSETVKPIKNNTFKLIDCLRKDTSNIEKIILLFGKTIVMKFLK